MIVTLTGDNGEQVDLDIPKTDQIRSLYAFAPHKCGSVLLQNIVKDLCDAADFPFLNIYSDFFTRGILARNFKNSIASLLHVPGYCYGGLRSPTLIDTKAIAPHRKIFLLRDPRDVIVSYYFSITKSHAQPGAGVVRDAFLANRSQMASLSIDEFVQQEKGFAILENIRTFLDWSRNLPQSTLFKYEDIIFEKENWVAAIAESFEFILPKETIKIIADRHDVRPTDENPDRHIRQVTPGNYKKHLSAQSISVIETAFHDVLNGLSY